MENEILNFALKFLKLEMQREEGNQKNFVYSPLSIKYALNMLCDGAEGNTKAQIQNLLQGTKCVKYNDVENILSVANALYIKDNYSDRINPTYQNELMNKYNAYIKFDNFKNANNINEWIKSKTLYQIQNMLEDSTISSINKLLIINALAIDIEWEDKFREADTRQRNFYLANNDTKLVAMMNQEIKNDSASYYINDNITAVSLDLMECQEEQLEFIAIMPNGELFDFVNNITANELNNIIGNLIPSSKNESGIYVMIPGFSFEYKSNPKKDLINLGVTEIFSEEDAKLPYILNEQTFVGDILHKSNIKMSEKGLKAAAAMVVEIYNTAIFRPNPPILLKLDHPFMYLIRDKKTNEVWFTGTVYDPESWEDVKQDYKKPYAELYNREKME